MSEDIIEHYGKKGMKWGVRRAANNARLSYARGNVNRINNAKEGYKSAASKERTAAKVGGTTANKARLALAKHISNGANKDRRESDTDTLHGSFNAHRQLSVVEHSNARVLSKLESKAKNGSAKDKKNYEAFKAYSNATQKQIDKTRNEANSAYKDSQKKRQESFDARNDYVNALNKFVYKGSNNHGDTNQLLDQNYKNYKGAAKQVAAEYTKSKKGGK